MNSILSSGVSDSLTQTTVSLVKNFETISFLTSEIALKIDDTKENLVVILYNF